MPNDYTKTAIKAAFIRLLNERPLNKISVKSIVDICNISRNTFYYHYQDIPSLLEEIIIEAANTLTQQHDTALSMETCIESAYEFAKNNRRAVYHIYNAIDRNAYEDFLMRMCAHTARLVVGGGGSRNPTLLRFLAEALPECRVQTQEDLGYDSDSKEAVAFALLANEALFGVCNNAPSATGASHGVVMGRINL